MARLAHLQGRKNEMVPEAYQEAVDSLTEEIEACEAKYPPCEDTIKTRPSYFNTGCCRFADGDITGIELAGGWIRLIKWDADLESRAPVVLEQMAFREVFGLL
jgi:hypothetical protein